MAKYRHSLTGPVVWPQEGCFRVGEQHLYIAPKLSVGAWEHWLACLARRPHAALVSSFLFPVLLRVVLLPWFPAPVPRVHDEFAFLLGADTLAHGRLANPQHPMWTHFESIHILSSPVYASAFPMAQSALLAFGQIIFGNPWIGVLLSAGAMSLAMHWMLLAWVPPRWALLGGLLASCRWGIPTYWINSYWGGFLAAIGGALVLGALPRMRRNQGSRNAFVFGIGLVLLANTRPVEGAWFAAIISTILIFSLLQIYRIPKILKHVVLPLTLILGSAALFMSYLNTRVTGIPWLHPYLHYRRTLTVAPHFLWQEPRVKPNYRNAALATFYVDQEMHDFEAARSRPWRALWHKAKVYGRFYWGPLLGLSLIALPALWQARRHRELLFAGLAFPLFLAPQVWTNAHYAAPATGLSLTITILCMRRLRASGGFSRTVAQLIPIGCLLMLIIQIGAGSTPVGEAERGWRWPRQNGIRRAAIQSELQHSGGKHLIVVRYSVDHEPGDEWVYNDADIDAAPVVWARELDAASNAVLLAYFGGRTVWLLEPDKPDSGLLRYPKPR